MKKRQKMEFLVQKNLFFCGIFLSGQGGYPPPLNGQNPLKRFWKLPLLSIKHTLDISFYLWQSSITSIALTTWLGTNQVLLVLSDILHFLDQNYAYIQYLMQSLGLKVKEFVSTGQTLLIFCYKLLPTCCRGWEAGETQDREAILERPP